MLPTTPKLHLAHLEQRMRQSGDWKGNRPLDAAPLQERFDLAIADAECRHKNQTGTYR
jgi:hypothetical protein